MFSKSDQFSAPSRSNKRQTLLALGVIAAGVGYYNKDMIHSKLNPKKVNSIEYDSEGHPMHLVGGDQLESFIQYFNDGLVDNTQSLSDYNTEFFPYEFWTAPNSRGENAGQGLKAGNSYIVLRNQDSGKDLTDNHGGHWRHENSFEGKRQKWTYEKVSNTEIAIKSYAGKYGSCNGNKIHSDASRIQGWEKFKLYQTSSCSGTGLPEGNKCVAIKANNGNNGGWVFAHPDEWVWCDQGSANSRSKWGGWNNGADGEWTLESLVYDHSAATIGAGTPMVLGTKYADARSSSSAQSVSIEVTYETSSTTSWEKQTGVELTAGFSFTVGIPFVGETETSVETTVSHEHTWGEENTHTESVTISSECNAAKGYKEKCQFIATKAILDVPYTMTLSKPGGYVRTQQGIWHGVSTYHVEKTAETV